MKEIREIRATLHHMIIVMSIILGKILIFAKNMISTLN